MQTIEHIPLADIEAARRRLSGLALRTPLVRLNVDDAPAEIWLKLENLQPIGSFKLRGAGNAMTLASRAELARGEALRVLGVAAPHAHRRKLTHQQHGLEVRVRLHARAEDREDARVLARQDPSCDSTHGGGAYGRDLARVEDR